MNGFAERLKKLRKENGLSQEALGNKLGVGQTSIANYEANKRIPSLEVFISIANIFNVSLDYLAGTISTNKTPISDSTIEISPEGENYLNFLLEGEKRESFKYILHLKKLGWQNIDIYEKIMVPLLRKTGDLWEKGDIKVSEEHFISNAVLDSISHLHNIQTTKKSKEKILMATVDQEEHIIGLKIMENILAQKGYDTYFLGSKTTSKHLIESIKLQKPQIIILAITLQRLVFNLEQTIRSIRRKICDQNIKIIVAGKGIESQSELVYEFGADAYGINFNDVLDIIKDWTND